MNAEHEQSSGKKTLVDTLLAIDSRMPTSSAEGREVAKEVLRRDRRRVRILTWMTIAFVLLVTIGIYGSFLMFYTYITPKMDKCAEEISKLEPLAGAELTTARSCQALYFSQIVSLWMVSASVTGLLVAAFSTVLLIKATRGATLRQIQASLLALSEQFDTLQQSLQGGQPSGGGQATPKPGT